MDFVTIDIRQINLDSAVKKLIKSILCDNADTLPKKRDLWEIIEDMSMDDFMLLKRNVYFADFLRLFGVEFSPSGDTCSEFKDNTESVGHVDNSDNDMIKSKIGSDISLDLGIIKIPSLVTRLDDLILPNRFSKLVKRLRNISSFHESFHLGETLGDLVSLSTSDIACLPGVGLSYVEAFKELKILANTADEIDIEVDNYAPSDNKINLGKVDTSNMRLCLGGVDQKFAKALEKYARYIGAEDVAENLDDILSFNRSKLLALPGFGEKIVHCLIEFRDVVRKEIESILAGNINYQEFESSLISPKVFSMVPIEKAEKILLEDVDNFIDRIEDDEADIAQKRWGFVEDKQTLEQIASNFDVTRERIRQKESKINSSFIRHLRIHPKAMWQLIEPELSSSFRTKFNKVFSCFTEEKDFYDFLSLICGQTNLFEYVYPELDKTILNILFAENGAPLHLDDIREYISQLNLSEIKNIDNAIYFLEKRGVLLIDGENIWPRQLGKAEASACILFHLEGGLPWLDVARLVNARCYSRTDIYEDRLDNEAFKLPDYIYLAGKGVYRHTRFIDVESISLDDIFISVMEYAQSDCRDVFHLMECYQASAGLQAYDYFIIRHLVKHFGEDYGFYFYGRSQSDSVGLKKGFKNITQKDVIIEAMNRSERPLTKTAIANLLKSKSSNHAAFYLDALIEDGKVVQVDRMLYTTPSCAYKDIVVDDYVVEIGIILNKYQIPVESSIIKKELNNRFLKCFSKYFYASIARLYARDQGWFRKNSLYSINEIPFRNLKAVIENVCNLEFSVNDNIEFLQKHVAITKESATIALYNWRNSP
ncbi:sigma factor-like helix-turn-helix DNA-binding protein [Thorsellia anophelis]|uniref:Sigma-70, region 4 n=1 Tax=Thorsellia anophelis DSM 18579 TaxID=1123402 RepID=A0A1H9YZU4_9GAMM|nr:sigma factor-like helix-turn-helix DNA-binding protein [Thorsellia anophelis]SES74722.1 Sigma-70, region 4 [Thorsellia anophelis DSM 18579]SET14169.1 Sigma-70, region 4 [Thorsellia anophelis DSM 18579]SET17723.1 Sigma-70, region 4 [Thorsellia anophelis DSM 18579]SET47776.1 Sigma-70, region 4 [Thorsellia anophelis DSM 18579]